MARPTNATLDQQPPTAERIMAAARDHFRQKGLAGARMHEIAADAGLNKAMLHYYFRSKEDLFDAVFRHDTEPFRLSVVALMLGPLPLRDKITAFVNTYLDFVLPQPHIPVFMLTTLTQFPERMGVMLAQTPNYRKGVEMWSASVREAVARGEIRPIEPVHLWQHVLGLTLIGFIARPMLTRLFDLSPEAYAAVLEQRRQEVPTFILNALRPDA